MPTARLFAKTSTARAALLAAIIVLAIAFVPLPTTRNASACPVVVPVPLRALYMNSDLVVVARFGETTPVELLHTTADGTYKTYLMKTDLRVSSTVKGSRDFSTIHFYHWGFAMNEGKYQHSYDGHTDADKLLVFLNSRKDERGYEATDDTYGVKKLSDADLKVYLHRIDELAVILQQEKPDQTQIVEWLVRCAEEPATRWEGLYEFSNSAYTPLDSDEKETPAETDKTESVEVNQEAHDASEQVATDNAGDASSAEADSNEEAVAETDNEQTKVLYLPVKRLYERDPDMARLLTTQQKTRLSDILFNTKTITDNELLLINLVRRWDSTRVFEFVMSQLRGFANDPPYAAQSLVLFMAEKFKDEELTRLAEKYYAQAMYDNPEDDAISDDVAESESAAEATEETEEDSDEKGEDEEAIVGSNTEKRSIRLKQFIAHLESVLARQGWQGNELVTPPERAVALSGQPKQ